MRPHQCQVSGGLPHLSGDSHLRGPDQHGLSHCAGHRNVATTILPGVAPRTQAGRGGPRVPLPRRPEDDAVVRADLRGHRRDGRRGDPAGGCGRSGKTEVPPRQGACWSRGHPGETGHCARLQQGTTCTEVYLTLFFYYLEITLAEDLIFLDPARATLYLCFVCTLKKLFNTNILCLSGSEIL